MVRRVSVEQFEAEMAELVPGVEDGDYDLELTRDGEPVLRLGKAPPPAPSAPDTERAVIGSMLQEPLEFIGRAVECWLTPEQFDDPFHAALYRLLLERYNRNDTLDPVSIAEAMRDRPDMVRLEGANGLAKLMSDAAAPDTFKPLVDLL